MFVGGQNFMEIRGESNNVVLDNKWIYNIYSKPPYYSCPIIHYFTIVQANCCLKMERARTSSMLKVKVNHIIVSLN